MRQLNNFSGSNLALAPDVLVIPATSKSVKQIPMTAEQEREIKVRRFLLAFKQKKNSSFNRSEAMAYLEMNDYDVEKAIEDAKADSEWEHST